MRFEEALAELRKDPDHSLMTKPSWIPKIGYKINKSGLYFYGGSSLKTGCPQILPTDYLAEDWEIKTTYHSGVEAIEALRMGKWIKHRDWENWYNIDSEGFTGNCHYTQSILRCFCENAWLIKDSM
jgi:hypothetical protein